MLKFRVGTVVRLAGVVGALSCSSEDTSVTTSAVGGPAVAVTNATQKVRPVSTDLPAFTFPSATTINLDAAKNEFEPFQIVFDGGNTGITNLTVTKRALTGPGGATLPLANIRLYQEALVNITYPSNNEFGDTTKQDGDWPDPLVPDVDAYDGQARNAFPMTVAVNQRRAVWVDVYVPSNQTPGNYTGTFTVQGTGLTATDLTVNLRVRNFALPSTSTLKSLFQIYSSETCRAHYGLDCWQLSQSVQDALLTKYARAALDHRFTVADPYYVMPTNNVWTQFDAYQGTVVGGTSPTQLPGARLTSFHSGYSNVADLPGMQQRMIEERTHFQANGWAGGLLDYNSRYDEPSGCTHGSPPTFDTWAATVHAAGLRTVMTTDIAMLNSCGWLDDVDVAVPVTHFMHPKGSASTRPLYDAFLAQGPSKELWWYQSCMSHGCGGCDASNASDSTDVDYPSYVIDTAATQNRAMEWLSYVYDVKGELYWNVTAWETGAQPADWSNGTAQCGFGGNGDGNLFYAGIASDSHIGGTTDIPIESIRIKMIREGMEDYEYLHLYEAKVGRTAAVNLATSVFANVYSVVDSPTGLYSARTVMADAIEAPATIPTDVVGFWRLDETSGTTASDSSANAQTLTLTNGPVWTAGKLNNALQFDGVNDYAVRTNPAAALEPTGAVAVSAWVNTTVTDTDGSEVVSMGDSYSMRVLSDGNARFFIYTGTVWTVVDTTGTNVKDGAWHHIVGQYTGSQLQIYVDGVFKNQASATGSISYTLGTGFNLGRHGNGGTTRDFSGRIDQVRIYARALTSAEIGALAAETSAAACGNGVVEGTEQCDGGACCSASCTFVSASTVCRTSAGVCDVAESCTGSSATCPTDGFASSSTVCRTSAGVCDVAESCTGSSATCPTDGFASSSTVCRTSAGVCDVAESCPGNGASCPADGFASSSTVCRTSAGVCDVAESCPGNAASCPADGFASSSTVCRSSAGVCDVAESCPGNAASCPADGFASSSTVCRSSAGVCDVAELCPGNSASCPANGFASSSTVCRTSAGVCDVVESCPGNAASCPADGFASSSTVCRTSAGICDVAESCSGSSASCPTDGFVSSSTVCRSSTGECDVSESCTGSSASCPSDGFVPDGTQCSAGVCVAGGCDETSAAVWFKLDDGSGTTALDTANAQDLTLVNGPTWTTGRVGGALHFDGVDDYAIRTSPSAALKPSTAVAISALLNMTATDTDGSEIVSMGDSYAMRVLTTGNLRFLIYSAGNWAFIDTTGVNLKDGIWHHVLGQYTGSQLQIYIDGVLKVQAAASGTIDYSLGPSFFVGRHGNGLTTRDFSGTLDQVRVYGRALTASEIAALFGENVPTDFSALWKLDETSGTTAGDASTNAQTLTLTNGPVWTAARMVGGLRFDGVNDYAVRTSPAAALKPTSAVAVSAWVNTTTTDIDGGEVVSMGDNYAMRVLPDGNLRFFIYSAGNWASVDTTGVNLKNGAWHHAFGQYTGSLLQIYIDGVFKVQVAKTGAISYALGTGFNVGRHGNGGTTRDFTGTLDQVRVYARALTATEISALAAETSVLP